VRSKFSGRAFPKPVSGCVIVNVPIKFQMKGT
jgi:hypothetical protein